MNKATFRKALSFFGLGSRSNTRTDDGAAATGDGLSLMRLTIINTEAGPLKLRPASSEEIKSLGLRWPMGLVITGDGSPNGLNFQVGEEEAFGLKMQPPDTDEMSASAQYFINLTLIAAALPEFLKCGHLGVVLPCVYLKAKGNERFESGIALFVNADPASFVPELQPVERAYDELLGDGATKMVLDFVSAMHWASKKLGVRESVLIGFDVRPRLQLGSLGMPLVAVGQQLIAIQHPLRPEHAFWEQLVRAGYTELPYAAMRTSAVDGPPNVPHSWRERMRILASRQKAAAETGTSH